MKTGLHKILYTTTTTTSIYRGSEDIEKYYFSGLTPNFLGSTLSLDTKVIFLGGEYVEIGAGRIWFAQILHEGDKYYISTHHIQPDWKTIMDFYWPVEVEPDEENYQNG